MRDHSPNISALLHFIAHHPRDLDYGGIILWQAGRTFSVRGAATFSLNGRSGVERTQIHSPITGGWQPSRSPFHRRLPFTLCGDGSALMFLESQGACE